MQIVITERHTAATGELKSYTQEKAAKLLRYYDRIGAIEVVLDGAADQAKAEMIVKVEGSQDLVAWASERDYFASVDVVVDKLESQLRKHKEKLRNRKHVTKSWINKD